MGGYYDDLYKEFYDDDDKFWEGQGASSFSTWKGWQPPPTPADPKLELWLKAYQESNKGAPKLKYPLFWWAPFWSSAGYGVEALQYMSSLLQYKLVRPEDLWIRQSGDGRDAKYTDQLPADKRDLLAFQQYDEITKVLPASDVQRPAVVVCHSFPDCWWKSDEWDFMGQEGCPCPAADFLDKTIYRVGRSMFETNELPEHLAGHAKGFDEIWVPSEFNRESFARAGVDKSIIKVLPESINTTLYDPAKYRPMDLLSAPNIKLVVGRDKASKEAESEEGGGFFSWGRKSHKSEVKPVKKSDYDTTSGTGQKKFTFLSVFKWESRKGWDILINSYMEEFAGHDDVQMVIITHPFMEAVDDWKAKVRDGLRAKVRPFTDKELDSMPPVYIHTDYIPDEEYPAVYRSADVLVQPTRGEGWGRPEMEAMAMGLPVIATNWSGLTAFINDEVAYPLRIDGLVDTVPDGPNFFMYFKGQQWAQPSATHLRKLMRRVYKHRDEARAKAAAARVHIKDHYSDEVVAQILRKLVDDVQVKVHNKVMPPVADWQPSPPPKPPSSDSDSDYDKPSSKKKSSSKKGQKGKKGKKGSWSSFFGGSRASYD